MIIFLILVVIVILIVINMNMAAKMSVVVSQKGYNPDVLHIMAWCLWVPIFGYLYVIALPDLRLREQNKEIIDKLSPKAEIKEEPTRLPNP
ncbi:MAG: hypothetical protein HDT44_10905 [Ruminococcaceae bacterium]|nr:hypothetical protein [Oscillospiraceae bacterium]